MTVIHVAHDGADYDVVVGPLADALPRIAELAEGAALPLVTDREVLALHGQILGGLTLPPPIFVPEGEAAKDWHTLQSITDQLASHNVKRGTPVIALGGGSVGDVAGLAASLFKRGSPIIHIPTTLLAQADSAVGGKTGIDSHGQKNLVGTFHHPALVIADPSLLGSLDDRQLRSGYAEVVKYGLIDDAEFFEWCEANGNAVLGGEAMARRAAIEHCLMAKIRFVSSDPDDTSGNRALLNFGHTFGHAIEALAGRRLLHGEAVAIGMTLAFQFSAELGCCSRDDAGRVEAHLQASGLPTTISGLGLNGSEIFEAMQSDKKATSAGLTLVLTHGIGQAFVTKDVDPAGVFEFLKRRF